MFSPLIMASSSSVCRVLHDSFSFPGPYIIPMSTGHNFMEGTESGQVNRLKYTHKITNKRHGKTVRIIHRSSTAISDIPFSRD